MKRDIVHDVIRLFLTVATTFGFFACLAMLMWKATPEGNREVLLVMTGALGTAWSGCIVAWAFGSSAQSAAKDSTIASLSKAAVVAAILLGASPAQALPYIDASTYSGWSTTGDMTSIAQQAINDGWSQAKKVIFPTSFNFTSLALYQGSRIECAGINAPITRTAVGPGIYTTNSPSTIGVYPTPSVWGVSIRDCAIQSSVAGANITLMAAQTYSLENVRSVLALPGASFVGSLTGANMLGVESLTNGTVSTGMMILCPGCLRQSTDGTIGNTYPVITGGSGSSFTVTSWTPSITSVEMIAVPSWTWSASPGNKTLPSAAVFYLGPTYDGAATNLYAGGQYTTDESACQTYSAIGLLMDTTGLDGTHKPNHNAFTQLYTPCSNIGVAVLNGADNLFQNVDLQDNNYGFLIGSGQGNAWRNVILQPYFEGNGTPASQAMRVAVGLGPNGGRGLIAGGGSLQTVLAHIANPFAVTYCWQYPPYSTTCAAP